MQNKNLLHFFSIFLVLNIYGKIYESKNILSLHEHVYPKDAKNSSTIVILDLDQTTFMPKNYHHVSDPWFEASIEHLQKEHKLSFMQALDIVLPKYIELQATAEMEPVEIEIVDLISKFQKDKVPVIAVTARSLPLDSTTLKQLKSIGIDFSHNCLAKSKEINFSDLEHPCKYKNGILFVSNNNKGKALARFLKEVNYVPEKVVCADDKLKHVEAIEQVCKDKNIEFIGIRYSNLDDIVKSYKLPADVKAKLSHEVKLKN